VTEIDKFRSWAISRFGPFTGNLLCQQYAVHSEILDITSDPKVACFFATRKWPGCVHIAQSADLGVVYRWEIPEESIDNAKGLTASQRGTYYPFSGKESYEVSYSHEPPGSPLAMVVNDRPTGFLKLPLEILTVDDMKRVTSGQAIPTSTSPEGRKSVRQSLADFRDSRWYAQRGGLIRPEMIYPCCLSEFEDRLTGRKYGGVSITDPVAIRDSLETDCVKKYYFKQSPSPIDIEPSSLWLSAITDSLFRVVCDATWIHNSDYYRETGVRTPWDRYGGLLDRGIYSIEVNDKSEYDEYVEWCEAQGSVPDLFDDLTDTANCENFF
jgi:hypothetical protein